MPPGGSRNRSGPSPDPSSLRSANRGLSFRSLPASGFDGDPPAFPLEHIVIFTEHYVEKRKVKEHDPEQSEHFADREARVWAEAWTSPQAVAWSTEPWRWPIVAEYCRLKTVVELDPSASAALVSQLHRYRDQIGMTPAGLKENGWEITAAAPSAGDGVLPSAPSARGRLSVVPGGA